MREDHELFLDGPPFLCPLLGRPRRQLEKSLGRADVCGGHWIRVASGAVSCAYYLYNGGADTLLAHGTVFVVTYDASDVVVDARYYRE